ncbi:hypothetical protein S100390_v1c07320 [Spiroplasma sp. NBRC 100390]|nr:MULTISPECIES: hypothetical protein [unclassified Spiroplasma]AOX44068.1 hypothetical protein STU14_v1c07320 [Spiroplasma sp. TU-14]APE13538.1 hypothetical protein S100390_v1c07320 [Spiroplasma sp. NBRC 100390]
MEKINNIVKQIEQVKQICGEDFTKWPNNMAPDILKVVYEQLKEVQNEKS